MISREQMLERCCELPASHVGYPFGEATGVFKVSGRMFALVDLTGEQGHITVKADPGYAAALVERHPQVTPGYYMNKRHWITIELGQAASALPAGLVGELVEESYELVVAGLPARLRPLAPAPAAARPPARQATPGVGW